MAVKMEAEVKSLSLEDTARLTPSDGVIMERIVLRPCASALYFSRYTRFTCLDLVDQDLKCSIWELVEVESSSLLSGSIGMPYYNLSIVPSHLSTGNGTDNATLFGVCLHVKEIVSRSSDVLGVSSSLFQSAGACNRFLVYAPCCYCLITRLPFFELHYEMLNSIVTQVRLNRITKFVIESAHPNYGPASPMAQNQFADAGFKSKDEVSSFLLKTLESQCPKSSSVGEVSEFNQAKVESSKPKNLHQFDDFQSQTSKIRGVSLGGNNTHFENCHSSPDLGLSSLRSSTLEHLASSESLFRCSVRSMALEGEKYDKNVENDLIMKWAKENNNDLLQIICGYEALPLPSRGSEVNTRLAAAEQALSLSLWTVATVCRVLSLESVMCYLLY
ncbi:hypothetical protein Syun_003659 [Stephania yunnanensis]|uniref:Uncharacterized protein n=1 Tax=Stephania yunnanensis TaxID=152371 RepID=A0AAP0Q012_9MAGN